MLQGNISLKMEDILEKEFKIDARGYRMQEVDHFLDIIIRDYNEYNNIISELIRDKKNLTDEINDLKLEIRNLRSSINILKDGEKEITNVDLLRRISQLEKIVFEKEQ